jgi:hypothetical protein
MHIYDGKRHESLVSSGRMRIRMMDLTLALTPVPVRIPHWLRVEGKVAFAMPVVLLDGIPSKPWARLKVCRLLAVSERKRKYEDFVDVVSL